MITSEGQEVAVIAFVAAMTAVALVVALAVSLVRRSAWWLHRSNRAAPYVRALGLCITPDEVRRQTNDPTTQTNPDPKE